MPRNSTTGRFVSIPMRHALRRLVKAPAFTLTAIITLGAAIGANVLIFSVVNGVLLKPLPFADPSRLVGVWHTAPGMMAGPLNQSAATYLMYREDGKVFQDIGLWDDGSVTLTGRGDPEQVEVAQRHRWHAAAARRHAGARPHSSRGKTMRPAARTRSCISSQLLAARVQRQRERHRATVDGQRPRREIIGVLPQDFRFLRANPAVVTPFRFKRAELHLRPASTIRGIARLKPGVTIDQANADVARLLPTLLDRFPMPPGFTRKMFDDVRIGPLVRPLEVDVVGDIGRMLWILFGTVGIVLLVACANVANLFLVRAEGRQQELAVRLALGAGTKRVVQELLVESVLLGVIGGVVGLGLAYAGIQLLLYLQPARLPRLEEITLDPIVLALHARPVDAGRTAVRHPSRLQVRAAAARQRAQGQQPRIERRTRAPSRPQHAGRRAGRDRRGAAGRIRA